MEGVCESPYQMWSLSVFSHKLPTSPERQNSWGPGCSRHIPHRREITDHQHTARLVWDSSNIQCLVPVLSPLLILQRTGGWKHTRITRWRIEQEWEKKERKRGKKKNLGDGVASDSLCFLYWFINAAKRYFSDSTLKKYNSHICIIWKKA